VTAAPLRIGVIGYGYWGPNLVRNFAAGPRTRVVAICCSIRPMSRAG
jgi:predicted dehydrogenase